MITLFLLCCINSCSYHVFFLHRYYINLSFQSFRFKCCVCDHQSKNWNTLLPHIVTHPEMKEQLKDADMVANIYGTFKCSICKFTLVISSELCSLFIGNKWSSLLALMRYYISYLRFPPRISRFFFFIGKKIFDKLANLKLHISKVHYKQLSTCNICGQTFVIDEKTFKRHVDKCTGITYQCEHCKYNTMVQVNTHTATYLIHSR